MKQPQVQILIITLISIVFSLAGCNSSQPNGELFNSISLGLPLGVLVAKSIPDLPEEPGDEERREMYTQMLQDAADGLNITLSPPPDSLLGQGRGYSQYQTLESYFAQITNQTADRSECIKYTTGVSLASAWLIVNFHEVQNLSQADMPVFRDMFVSKLDQFVGLSAIAAYFCKQEGYVEFATRLDEVSEESLNWKHQAALLSDEEVAAEVVSIGNKLADRLVELAEIASGLSTP